MEQGNDSSHDTHPSHTVEGFRFAMEADDLKYVDDIAREVAEAAISPDIGRSAAEIVRTGALEGRKIGSELVVRNGYDELAQRQYIAEMYAEGGISQEAAEAIIGRGICGFHVTRSEALAGIIESGQLQSTQETIRQGAPLATGEHYYQSEAGQDSISFGSLSQLKICISQYAGSLEYKKYSPEYTIARLQADVEQCEQLMQDVGGEGAREYPALCRIKEAREEAIDQIKVSPDTLFAIFNMNQFPVALGITSEAVEHREDMRQDGGRVLGNTQSYYGEFRPAGEVIPLQELPVIAVPEKIVKNIQGLMEQVGYPDTKVIAIEALAA